MKQLTARFRTVGLGIAARSEIRELARFFRIIDITSAGSCQIAFGEEQPQTVDEGMAFELPADRTFDKITLINNTGVAITVRYAISDDRVYDDRVSTFGGLLLTIDGRLANIDADTTVINNSVVAGNAILTTIDADTGAISARLAGVAGMTQLDDTLVAATGAAATVLFAANANRKRISITASDGNLGIVSLGSTVGTSATVRFTPLLPGGNWTDDHYQGAVYAVGSDALQIVCGYEE